MAWHTPFDTNASEVLRDALRRVEQREAEDAAKLKAQGSGSRWYRGADRGDFKGNIEELQSYLNDLSEKASLEPLNRAVMAKQR